MNSIFQYLKELEAHIIALGGQKELVEEYSSHLEAEFDDFIASQTIAFEDTRDAEELFVNQLESPKLIAQSLLGVEEEKLRIAEDISVAIIITSQVINRIFGFLRNKYDLLSRLYSEYRAPPLTALLYFLVVMISLYSYRLIRNLLFDTPPLDSREAMLTFLFIFLIIASLGWKYSFRDAVQSAFFFSIYLAIVFSILGQEERLWRIKNRLLEFGFTLSQDWYRIPLPPVTGQILEYLQQILLERFFFVSLLSIPCLLLGAMLKHIYLHRKRLFLFDKGIYPLFKPLLFIICIMLILTLPTIQLKELVSTQQVPIPIPTPDDCSLIYRFEDESRSDNRIVLKEFGYISFQCDASYNVTVIEPVDDDMFFLNGKLTLLQADLGWETDVIEGTGSQFNISLLGTLFLPDTYDDHTWHDIVGQEINISYPFNGYHPTIDTEQTAIKWRINDDESEIAVNTIKYQSLSNNSVFTFSFDKTTGWLLEAELNKGNGSWVSDASANILHIERWFLYEVIDDITSYRTIDSIMILATFFTAGVLVLISSVYYYIMHKKKY